MRAEFAECGLKIECRRSDRHLPIAEALADKVYEVRKNYAFLSKEGIRAYHFPWQNSPEHGASIAVAWSEVSDETYPSCLRSLRTNALGRKALAGLQNGEKHYSVKKCKQSGFDYLDNFTRSVSGYTPKNFELQRQGEELQVRASDIIEYERMTLRVSHQTRVMQVTHHQRVIDMMFEGGDLEKPLTLQWAVTVNFYNLNPGITDAFNETCSMNGELIKK